jgi:Flp pilus assembly protein TadD
MHSVNKLPLALVLLLSACGLGPSAQDSRKSDAVLAETALTAGTPQLALNVSDATLAQNPKDADALTRRGLALTELRRLDEARDSLRKAVMIEPGNVRALLALGRVELPVDPAAAETDFESALKKDSHNVAALSNLGIARDLQGHHADAEAAYRSALAIQPDLTAAQVNLALCLAIQGKGGDAIRVIQPLADAAEATPKIKEDYAAVLAMAGNRDEAQRILSANMAPEDVARALDVLTQARVAPAPDQLTSAAPLAAPVVAVNQTPIASGHAATVQLASLNSEAAAHDEWEQLSKRFPALLGGRQPVFTRAERDGHSLWRVRTSGFDDVAQAQTFCDRLRTAGSGCAVYNF